MRMPNSVQLQQLTLYTHMHQCWAFYLHASMLDPHASVLDRLHVGDDIGINYQALMQLNVGTTRTRQAPSFPHRTHMSQVLSQLRVEDNKDELSYEQISEGLARLGYQLSPMELEELLQELSGVFVCACVDAHLVCLAEPYVANLELQKGLVNVA